MLLYGLGVTPGPVESARFCAMYPTRACVDVMGKLTSVPPNRDILKSLGQLIMAREWFFTTNSLSTPYSLVSAFLHHAPADRVLAASVLSRAIVDDTYGAPIDALIDGLIDNLSTATPEDIRARAILHLTALADDSGSQFQYDAQKALAKVAHLTAAPTPPVVSPDDPAPDRPGPRAPRPDPGASRIAVAGFVGATLIAGAMVAASLWRRKSPPAD